MHDIVVRHRDPSPCLLRLNAQPWIESWVGESHGSRVGLRATHAAFIPRLLEQLRPALRPVPLGPGPARVDEVFSFIGGDSAAARGRARRLHLAYAGHGLVARGREVDAVVQAVEGCLHHFIAEHAPEHVFVHAGAVEWQGRALLFPGPSHSGKTTLIAALVQAGARYLSDEYGVLDAQARVHAYPKSLLVRGSEARARCAPESLGEVARGGPFALGGVVHTHYACGRRFTPRALSPAAASLALLSNAVAARSNTALVMRTLARAGRGVPAARAARGEAAQAVHEILAWATAAQAASRGLAESLAPDAGSAEDLALDAGLADDLALDAALGAHAVSAAPPASRSGGA